MRKLIDLTGKKFNRLYVIEKVSNNGNHHDTLWRCKCDCGNETIVESTKLRNGHTKSCGCLHTEVRKKLLTEHGLSNTKLFKVWTAMIERTIYKKNKRYKDYGGRGIIVCDEWKNDFKSFYDWAISNGYKEGLTIDRIDVNGNYEPNNCRWATVKEQNNNRRNNRLITYNGETHTMAEWSELRGIKYSTLSMRLNKYKWSIERCLEFAT